MHPAAVDILARYPARRHRLTRQADHRLGDAGVPGKKDRVDLLEGRPIDMSPIGPRNAIVTDNPTALLDTAFGRVAAGRSGWRRRQAGPGRR